MDRLDRSQNTSLAANAERTVVVGTAEGVAEARARLEHGSSRCHLVGCVPARPEDHAGIPDPIAALDDLEDALDRHSAQLVLIAIPQAMGTLANTIIQRVEQTGRAARWLPPLLDELTGPAHAGRSLDLAGLIGRPPRAIDGALVKGVIARKRVLITGAGGSIGSEIARIVASHNPDELILMERAENALFEIDRTLRADFPTLSVRSLLHDVVEAEATRAHLEALKPHVVFHAAAHKHVPMMEDHPNAAITNNVFGTKAVVDGAIACGAERFVLVSTDKAVHPTSVMGATKRLAELYVRSRTSATQRSVVRFGNVLGSACSVLPIWERQIAAGGPVTVTDERMTRYFMTIPEAASLVIQSAGLPTGDDNLHGAGVFVLDMGEPVRIVDLAHRMLDQFGLRSTSTTPDGRTSVDVRFTGVRPGEKLHEELAYDSEELTPTAVPGVRTWLGPAPQESDVDRMISMLDGARREPDRERVVDVIRACVPEMRPADARETPRAVVCTGELANTTQTSASHAA